MRLLHSIVSSADGMFQTVQVSGPGDNSEETCHETTPATVRHANLRLFVVLTTSSNSVVWSACASMLVT